VVETEHEAVEFVYQGQVDVVLKSGVLSSGRFSGSVHILLEVSYGRVSVSIRVRSVSVSIREVI